MDEIKAQPFFVNDQWDWNNIRQSKCACERACVCVQGRCVCLFVAATLASEKAV